MRYSLKSYQKPIFIFSLLIISIIYSYLSIINLPPYSIHQWRQVDCTSFASNYYKENLPFFKPATLNAGKTGDGKTVGEFPIIYFIVGKLWSVFGQQHYIFRIIDILIVFVGLFYLFKFINSLLGNSFWSLFIPLLIFTSPSLVYYTNNFIPDPPAFGLTLIGWYFFWKFYKQKNSNHLLGAMLLFAFAGLLKITTLIIYFAILGLFIFELLNLIKTKKKIFFKPIKHAIYFSIVLVLVFLWYYYAHWYNQQHNDEFFLLGIKPIWKINPEQLVNITRKIYSETMSSLLNRVIILITLCLFFLNIFLYKKADKILFTISTFTFVGSLAYLFLFYEQFNVHDYYLISLLTFPIFILLTSLNLLKDNYSSIFNNNYLKIIVSIALLALIYQTSGIQRLKYSTDDKFGNSNFLLRKNKKNNGKWFVDYTERTYGSLRGINPYLRSLGIKRDDLVLSVPDFSFNISLYLMDQKGYTENTMWGLSPEEEMEKFFELGVKYLVVHEASAKDWKWLQPYMTNKIGSYQQVEIYDLREHSKKIKPTE